MRAGKLICSLICVIVFMAASGGCAYVKKDVIVVPCVVPDNVSYANDIVPILEANCYDCHTTSSNSSGVLLDNYDALVFYAQNGYLYGNITHAPGYNPMPDGGGKLSDCTIATIKKWIDSGTPH